MKRNEGEREACLVEVFALIQTPPDILSPMSCLFCGPRFSSWHPVQKRCPCIVFVVNKVLYYFGSSQSWQHKMIFELKISFCVASFKRIFKTTAGSSSRTQAAAKSILTFHRFIKEKKERGKIEQRSCPSPLVTGDKGSLKRNEKIRICVGCQCGVGTFPFWSLHCDNQEERKEKRERRSQLDGHSRPQAIFYTDDKTEISEIRGAVLLITAYMTPTSFLPAKQRYSRYVALRSYSVCLRPHSTSSSVLSPPL